MKSIPRKILGLVTLAAFLALACFGCGRPVDFDSSTSKPRLVVLVVFDHMRGDYLTRWENLFTDRGFRRLMKDGAWFDN